MALVLLLRSSRLSRCECNVPTPMCSAVFFQWPRQAARNSFLKLQEFTGVVEPFGPGAGHFLRLRDFTAGLLAPCVLDVKARLASAIRWQADRRPPPRLAGQCSRRAIAAAQIGYTTADPSLGEAYAAKCARKDAETTTATLGFRLGGMQVLRGPESPIISVASTWRLSCQLTEGPTPDDLAVILAQVFERGPSVGGSVESSEQRGDAGSLSSCSSKEGASAAGADGLCLHRAPRGWCKKLDASGIHEALLRFFRRDLSKFRTLVGSSFFCSCSFTLFLYASPFCRGGDVLGAAELLSGPTGVLAQLRELSAWCVPLRMHLRSGGVC